MNIKREIIEQDCSDKTDERCVILVIPLAMLCKILKHFTMDDLRTILLQDKNRQGEAIHFVLLEGIGRPHFNGTDYTFAVPTQLIESVLLKG